MGPWDFPGQLGPQAGLEGGSGEPSLHSSLGPRALLLPPVCSTPTGVPGPEPQGEEHTQKSGRLTGGGCGPRGTFLPWRDTGCRLGPWSWTP